MREGMKGVLDSISRLKHAHEKDSTTSTSQSERKPREKSDVCR